MKLYYAPGACSLASRICFHEAGLAAEFERVDLKTKVTEHGQDYAAINAKGSVPMLVLDDGEAVTENVAILDLIAEREPALGVPGRLGRTRLIEMLAYLSSELHVAFKPLFHSTGDSEQEEARRAIARRLELIPDQSLHNAYLFGPDFTVADAYLFVMLRWAHAFAVSMPPHMMAFFGRVAQRPAVRQALAEEGLPPILASPPAAPAREPEMAG